MTEARDGDDPEPTGWAEFLAPGETILWQGVPDATPLWSDIFWPGVVLGGVVTAFALIWLGITGSLLIVVLGDGSFLLALGLSVFPLVGVALLAFGLFLIAGPVLWDVYLRRNTWYTLTDRTAFIATAPRGKRHLVRLPLRETHPLLEDGNPGTIWLTGTAGSATLKANGLNRREGFRRIEDAVQVFDLLTRARSALR